MGRNLRVDGYGAAMSLAEPTHAEQTFFAVMRRNDEPMSSMAADLPERILDPEETVIDVKVGDIKSDENPLLIATDRRMILTTRRAFRSWKVLKEAPAAQVVGIEYTPALLSGKLRVTLRGGSGIELRTRTKAQAQRFVTTIRGLLGS